MTSKALLALSFITVFALPAAAEMTEVTVEQAREMMGTAVETADDQPLGELIGVQKGPNGCAITIVKLHERLEVQTSPLQIVGLQVDDNGKLQVTDGSDALKRNMGLPY